MTFPVTIFEIREEILPELDSTFFEELKVKDLDKLKAQLVMELKNRKLQILRFE
jgi:FKBP-type peptidyl-prolyl cis-trans isomerase (trigger factor)